MKKWLIEKWDWFIYCRFYKVAERWQYSKPHWLYFIFLYMQRYQDKTFIKPELKESTEAFFEALEQRKYKDCNSQTFEETLKRETK